MRNRHEMNFVVWVDLFFALFWFFVPDVLIKSIIKMFDFSPSNWFWLLYIVIFEFVLSILKKYSRIQKTKQNTTTTTKKLREFFTNNHIKKLFCKFIKLLSTWAFSNLNMNRFLATEWFTIYGDWTYIYCLLFNF